MPHSPIADEPQRAAAGTTRRTTCNRDCPDACGIVATLDATGRITKLAGDPEHPVTRGFLCFRTSRFLERQYSPERLTTALVRRGGQLVPIGLDEALDLAASQLDRIRRESGPAAILHFRSGGSLGLLKLIADRFFEQLGPCTAKVGDICSGAGEAAQELDFGVSDSNDLFDLRKSRHVYVWGKNPFVSSVHLVPLLQEIRTAGTRVTLIDPVHHRGVALADRYVQPRPGADLELALGVARLLLDQGRIDPRAEEYCEDLAGHLRLVASRTAAEWAAAADVPVPTLAAMADDFADGPTAVLVGWGMQRRLRGASTVRALDALVTISGNLFRPGGGASFYFRRRGAFDTRALAHGPTVAPRVVREPLFAQDVLAAKDPPIRAIWVTAANPVCMLPDAAAVARAFEATEFTVVADSFLTDTARRASLVLPVPSLLEDDDLLGAYGHHWLAESRAVVPPPPGVRHEVELFQALAQRLGFGDALAGTVDDWKRRLLRKVEPRGVTLERLRERGALRNPEASPQRFRDGRVETPSGRVRLLTELPPGPSAEEGDGYPLWLFSNSTAESQASQWAGRGLGEHTWVRVHPDAAPEGRRDGDRVTIESALGSLRAELRLDPHQRRDVAIVPKGGHLDRGHAANLLIAARPTDHGLGAAYLDCRVRLR